MSPDDLDHADAAARMHASCGHPDDGVGEAYLFVRERIAALEARLSSAEAVIDESLKHARCVFCGEWSPEPGDHHRACAWRKHREAYPPR